MIKKILSISIIALAFFALSENANSQSIYFCEGVSKDGYPITESSTFNIGSDGGYVYVLVRLPYEVACRSVRLVIDRNSNYDNTIYVDTENNWAWFYHKVTFYKSGDYYVSLFDCYDARLVSGSVRINYR